MSKTIFDLLARHAMGDSRLAVLLDTCVGRLARRSQDAFEIDEDKLRHIVDWLRAALANDEPWLKNVDGQGRTKKLMKFGSVDAIVKEADKAMLKSAQKLRNVKLADGDEELVEMLADGYYVVRLLTPEALDRESAQMQHCIGNGGYDDYLLDGTHEYYSLRDPSGRPHVTVEVSGGSAVQLQGKQNATPARKYLDLLFPFITSRMWRVEIPASRLGYVIDINGDWHSIYSLPDHLEVNDNLILEGAEITELPRFLKVRRSLFIQNTKITRLPDNLTVLEDVYARGLRIAEIPAKLTVGGSLYLGQTDISHLPGDMKVGDDLDISCTNVARLPARFKVNGFLNLRATSITELPEGLVVKGSLYLMGSKIARLPSKMSVGGNLDLSSTEIEEIPENFRIQENLVLSKTEIRKLPSKLVVRGILDISETRIRNLPEDIKVGRQLNIKRTSIETLPIVIEDHVVISSDHGRMQASEFRELYDVPLPAFSRFA